MPISMKPSSARSRCKAQTVEDEKVASAIKTDFILSAEIMAITLAALPAGSLWMQALVLALVGIGITVAVYGVVALIVKADDVGLALARHDGASAFAAVSRSFGRGLVRAMPVFLTCSAPIGTAAMIWVGGGIVLHGLELYGPPSIGHAVHAATEAAAHALPSVAGLLEWIVHAAISGVIGLLIGAASIPIVGLVLAPAWKRLKRLLPGRRWREVNSGELAANCSGLPVLQAVLAINRQRIPVGKQSAFGLGQMHGDGAVLAPGDQELPDIFHVRPGLADRRQLLKCDQRGCQRLREHPFVMPGDSLFRHLDALAPGCSHPSTRSATSE